MHYLRNTNSKLRKEKEMKKKVLLLMLFFMFIATNALSQSTLQGTVTGDMPGGVKVSVSMLSCGALLPYAETTTDALGNYAIAAIEDGSYFVSTSAAGYSFDPEGSWVDIPQAEKKDCNFNAAINYCNFCGYGVEH
jgi:hypothetical protein